MRTIGGRELMRAGDRMEPDCEAIGWDLRSDMDLIVKLMILGGH